MNKKLLTITALTLALAACGKKEQPAPAEPAGQSVTAQAPVTAAPAYNKKETYFNLPLAGGKGRLDLATYAGKPVMFMFFTETCPFCRKAAPAVEKFHQAYGPKGLNVMGICIQDDAQAALDFAKSLGVTFPLAYKGRPAYQAYKAQGVPYIYLLDKDHKVYDVWEGYDPSYDPSMLKAIETVLAKK